MIYSGLKICDWTNAIGSCCKEIRVAKDNMLYTLNKI